jgi:hypothetical protein
VTKDPNISQVVPIKPSSRKQRAKPEGLSRQVNFRAFEAQAEYWKEAARLDGYNSLGAWIKWLCTERAAKVFAERDDPHGP